MSNVEIRAYDPAQDTSFVCDSFATSARQTFPYNLIRKAAAVEFLREALENYRAQAVVATFDGLVIGWAARVGDKLLFAFTKFEYRKRGIARALIAHLGLDPQNLEVAVWTRGAEKVNRVTPGRVRAAIAEELSK